MRLFRVILFSFVAQAVLAPFPAVSAPDPSAPRPNIILIMADDMGWSDIGCYGSEISTPNIDRLAAEGVQFTQFYNNGKCTTTRASLLTGLYPRNGGKGIELLNENMLTLGEALSMAGYQTGLSGKWHNGSKAPHRPVDRGFDDSYGLWDGCCNFFNPSQPDPKFKGGKVRFFGENDVRITEFPEDFFTTEAFTDHAIRTIRKHAAAGEPFFHYIAHTAPHYPLHARPEDVARYKGQYKDGWDTLRKARYQKQVEAGLINPATHPDPGPNRDNKPWGTVPADMLEYEILRMEVYAAMVDRMDREIGRVLETLDELKIADNTLILFLSDNGGCAEQPGGRTPEQVPGPKEFYSHCGPDWAYAQNAPFRRYKSTTYEGGIATPLVARWPASIEAGVRTDQVGHIIDFLPTFLELAGGDYPLAVDGKPILQEEGVSLVPVLTGEEKTIERPAPLFWHWSGNRAVREGNWKLVWEKGKEAEWQLYDLSKNRTETQNVADSQPSKVTLMSRKWEAWAHLTGVKY
ncbi:MAG: arylsulfatase [Verrucomicrobiales bacterium]|nr:arylsulfatase [Verrucomicrobiales bacterium]